MNSIVLLGRMTKDAEVRYTSTGKVVASFSLAVDRPYTGTDGKVKFDDDCEFQRPILDAIKEQRAKLAEIAKGTTNGNMLD